MLSNLMSTPMTKQCKFRKLSKLLGQRQEAKFKFFSRHRRLVHSVNDVESHVDSYD